MSSKSLPAYLQQALQQHVEQSQLTHDDELESIYVRLANLNENVEKMKQAILLKRSQKQS
ncbi:hypothetical protein Q4574_00240 [Aliiglaciecola sp. 3_MG-2023]|uniref:hypothetical protein n=1 Tax=Aliiglaciecola sp. 3_MG-2023 TaxID=3062644 RepID=UPI0026E25700|nr:hypothetical protein [Aliiglaciecola sp. 3_MG-2023]MDO6691683.1 hypothetical protein [Aliiglaciecola sp. 3_MG-2023]